jgi:hypothetical protein
MTFSRCPLDSTLMLGEGFSELERLVLSRDSPLWDLNASEVLVEREGIYQDP